MKKEIIQILKNSGFKDSEYIFTYVKDFGEGVKIYADSWVDSETGRVKVNLRMNLDGNALLDIYGSVTNEEELAELVKECCEKSWQKLEKKRKRIEETQLKMARMMLTGF